MSNCIGACSNIFGHVYHQTLSHSILRCLNNDFGTRRCWMEEDTENCQELENVGHGEGNSDVFARNWWIQDHAIGGDW